MHRFKLPTIGIVALALIFGCQTDPTHPDFSSPTSTDLATVTTLQLGDLKGATTDQLQIHGANGLALKEQGTLMVGSLFGREVTELETADGSLVSRMGPCEGVEGTGDLCYGLDGDLIWSNFWTGDVQRRLSDGSLQTMHVGEGAGPLVVDQNGVIYVARRFLGSGVYRVDPDTKAPPELIADPGTIGGLAVDYRGRLIASLWNEGTIVHIKTNSPTPEYRTLAAGFSVPAGIAFDPDGKLLVAEHLSGMLWRVTLPRFPSYHGEVHELGDIEDKNISIYDRQLVAELGPGLDDVVVEARGHAFVANSQDGTITKIYSYGGTRNVVEPGLILPGGVNVCLNQGPTAPLWVADAWTLRSFDRTSGEALDVHRCMLDVNGFTAPMTVALCGDDLIVSSWLGQVQRIDPVNCQIIETYEYDTGVEIPLNSVMFGDGMVVAGLTSGSVFDPATKAVIADGFETPAGLAVLDGKLWVADRSTGIVWQIADEGAPLPEPMMVASGLVAPEGLTCLHSQALLVVETGIGRLTKINLRNGSLATLAENLQVGLEAAPNQPETWQFNGVAMGGPSTAFVASDIANIVYKIELHEGGDHYDFADAGDPED